MPSALPSAFVLAFRQLGDRRILRVLAKSLAVTIVVFAGVGLALYRVIAGAAGGGTWTALAVLLATLAACWLAFRAVAVAVIGVFGDEVVQAVEARHYPAALATAVPVPLGRSLVMGLQSVGRLIGYNIVAAPVYLALLATGVGLPVGFLVVNGWLLGRDLGDMVAARHVSRDTLGAWRYATRWARFGVGLASAGLFLVPVVNLIAPIVGAAAMTHIFHRRRTT